MIDLEPTVAYNHSPHLGSEAARGFREGKEEMEMEARYCHQCELRILVTLIEMIKQLRLQSAEKKVPWSGTLFISAHPQVMFLYRL